METLPEATKVPAPRTAQFDAVAGTEPTKLIRAAPANNEACVFLPPKAGQKQFWIFDGKICAPKPSKYCVLEIYQATIGGKAANPKNESSSPIMVSFWFHCWLGDLLPERMRLMVGSRHEAVWKNWTACIPGDAVRNSRR